MRLYSSWWRIVERFLGRSRYDRTSGWEVEVLRLNKGGEERRGR
jgi:hypothetical protein